MKQKNYTKKNEIRNPFEIRILFFCENLLLRYAPCERCVEHVRACWAHEIQSQRKCCVTHNEKSSEKFT